MKYKGFIGGCYQSRAITFDSQRCINLFPEIDESQQGKEGQIGFLVGTPGLRLLTTLPGTGRVGGLYTASNGMCFAITDNKLYRIKSDWTYIELGTLCTTSGPVCMCDNGVQLVIVDGAYGYIYTFSARSFEKITDPDMPKANRCAYQDQYVIFNEVGTQKFYISALLDAGNIDSLDFASAEGSPDLLITLIDVHRELWLIGSQTTEVWINTGAAAFPFERVNGTFIEHGCVAPQSVAKIDNTIFWLGGGETGNGIVWRAEGFLPRRISTHAIEFMLSQMGDLSDASAYTYCEGGHQFYVLTVPGAETSLVYDVATSLWHERAAWTQGKYLRHQSNGHCWFNQTHVVNDYQNGKLYALDMNTYDDAGEPKRWLRSAPVISNSLKRLFFSKLHIDMQAGQGTILGQGSDPRVWMRYSNDGGRSWTSAARASMGKIGAYLTRCMWRALGSGRARVFEVYGSDPVYTVLMGAEFDAESGDN